MAVNPRMLKRASRITGVPLWILRRVDAKEGSGTSPAGAQGEFQLMPGTAAGLARRYGINTHTVWGNTLGGAYYLKEQYDTFKRWDYALAAYNAGPGAVHQYHGIPPYKETQDYVRSIMHGEVPGGGGQTAAGAHTSPNPVSVSAGASVPAYAGLTKKDVAIEGLQALASGDYDPVQGLRRMLEASKQMESYQGQPAGTPVPAMPAAPTAPAAAAGGNWKRWVRLAPGADRQGVSTQPQVLQFVSEIGRLAHRRLTISTGTEHNQYVVGTRRESAHWTGHAADIRSSGAQLTRLGRLALIAAGMSRREAMKVSGGLFNVGGYQIIFNSNEGGNHWNHLHVGIR